MHFLHAASTYGSEFHLGFMRNFMGSFTQLQLVIGTPEDAVVTFVVEDSNGIITNGTVNSSVPAVVEIPSSYQVHSSDYSDRFKGIKVSSTKGYLLYVIAENFVFFLNHGTYIAYPCMPLGEDVVQYEYGVISIDDPLNTQNSQVLLVGCSNDTVITVTPSVPISLPTNSQTNSSAYNISADELSGEILLHEKQTILLSSLDDLTGTIITSNKPLVVISGHECANIPPDLPGCEPLAAQVPPVTTWGNEFLLAPFAGRASPQYYKGVTSVRNTTISVTCGSVFQVHTPETNSFIFASLSYCHVQSTSPIFLVSASIGGSNDGRGDPAVFMVSPVDQYIQTIDFIALPQSDFPSSYATITVSPENYDPENTLLNDVPVDCSWQEIRDFESNIVGYGCNQNLSASYYFRPTKHSITHSANGSLSVVVYGFRSFPAAGYAYLTGQVLSKSITSA